MSFLSKHLEDTIKQLTTNLKLNLVGPHKLTRDETHKYIAFSYRDFDPKTTIQNAYLNGNLVNSGLREHIDQDTVNLLEDNALAYINKLEQNALADHGRIVSNYEHEVKTINKIVDPEDRNKRLNDIIKETKKMLKEQRKKLTVAASALVENELNNGVAFGAFDGILGVARKMGDSDPIVYKAVVNDELLCLEENAVIQTVNGNKKLKDLKVGDKLRSHLNTRGSQDRSIKHNSTVEYVKNTPKECIEIEFDSGKKIICTANHPVLIKINNTYLFWEIGRIPEKLVNLVDIVDSTSLSLKERKRMTAHINQYSLIKKGYKDVWQFIQLERDKIISEYENGKTIYDIGRGYTKSNEVVALVSHILKLSGKEVSKPKKHKNNNYNREYADALTARVRRNLIDNKEQILVDFKRLIPFTDMAKTYKITSSIIRDFIKKM